MVARMKNLPWHTKLVLALLALLPAWFLVASLGTKFGIWGWQFGLLTMTLSGGMILLALVGIAALVALVPAWRARPRG